MQCCILSPLNSGSAPPASSDVCSFCHSVCAADPRCLPAAGAAAGLPPASLPSFGSVNLCILTLGCCCSVNYLSCWLFLSGAQGGHRPCTDLGSPAPRLTCLCSCLSCSSSSCFSACTATGLHWHLPAHDIAPSPAVPSVFLASRKSLESIRAPSPSAHGMPSSKMGAHCELAVLLCQQFMIKR